MQTKTNSIIARKLERLKRGEKPRVLDLFAGAGGLSLGFLTAGFNVVAAVEINPEAARTHAMNFFTSASEELKAIHARECDITQVEPEQLLNEYGFDNPVEAIDVIIGGPPCQAFARVGRAKLREVNNHPEAFLQDPRGDLYLRFIHYVKKLRPLAILMENVPDALNYGGHNIAEETCEVLSSRELNYRCSYTLLNSAFYGVPQTRERMFLLAYVNELDCRVSFPQPTNWLDLPAGYRGSRGVAVKLVNHTQKQFVLPGLSSVGSEVYFFVQPPAVSTNLPVAISAENALNDLPPIYAQELLSKGILRKGVQNPLLETNYPDNVEISQYAHLMRKWKGFRTSNSVTGHIIRYLPRDYKLFERLQPGDQYGEAHACAVIMFKEALEEAFLKRIITPFNTDAILKDLEQGKNISEEYFMLLELWKQFVPPYDHNKFPNKWRKMERNRPARTVMAHLGKDSYSHIHYDSEQARTISVREAARIQSFPDGFVFSGKMNSAFKQIGNAVPPLLAYHFAVEMKKSFGQIPEELTVG